MLCWNLITASTLLHCVYPALVCLPCMLNRVFVPPMLAHSQRLTHPQQHQQQQQVLRTSLACLRWQRTHGVPAHCRPQQQERVWRRRRRRLAVLPRLLAKQSRHLLTRLVGLSVWLHSGTTESLQHLQLSVSVARESTATLACTYRCP